MGDRTTISGHIQEPWYVVGTAGSDDAQLLLMEGLNASVIEALPEVDEWPPLVRPMFSFTPRGVQSQLTFRGRVIYFGGSFPSLWQSRDVWLSKFENLLRRLHWEHASLTMVSEYFSEQHYLWRADTESSIGLGESPPRPIASWEFSGGQRSF